MHIPGCIIYIYRMYIIPSIADAPSWQHVDVVWGSTAGLQFGSSMHCNILCRSREEAFLDVAAVDRYVGGTVR